MFQFKYLPLLNFDETNEVRISNLLRLYSLDNVASNTQMRTILDVNTLLRVLQRLRDARNTVVIIELNLDVIKTADRITDMRLESG